MKHTSFLTVTAAAALISSAAGAATVSIDLIEAAWTNPQGGNEVVVSNGDPDRVEVSWGVPFAGSLNPNLLKSAYVFERAGTSFLATQEVPFNLGTFTHENWEIARGGGIDSVDLGFTFGGTPFDGVLRTFGATFFFDHNETPNIGSQCPGDAIPCDDIVTVSAAGGPSETVIVGNKRYTFTLLGFSTDDGFTFDNQFRTREAASSSADLYAVFTVAPIPLPAAGWLLLGGLGALGVAARRRRKNS